MKHSSRRTAKPLLPDCWLRAPHSRWSPDGARPRLVVAGPHDFAQKLLEGRDRGNTRAAVGGPRLLVLDGAPRAGDAEGRRWRRWSRLARARWGAARRVPKGKRGTQSKR